MSWDRDRRGQGRDRQAGSRGGRGLQRLGSASSGPFDVISWQAEVRAAYRGICRYLKVATWQSESMFSLPAKGQSRLVYLYLMTGPHTLAYHVPGLYNIGQQAIREGLRLSPQEFHRAMTDLRDTIAMKTDFLRNMVWLPSALTHLGPPANPNIVRGYCRALQSMPESPLRTDAIAAYGPFLAGLGPSFVEPFADGFPEVCQTMRKPSDIDNREKRIEKEHGHEPRSEVASSGAIERQPRRGTIEQATQADGSRPIDFAENLRKAREVLNSLG